MAHFISNFCTEMHYNTAIKMSKNEGDGLCLFLINAKIISRGTSHLRSGILFLQIHHNLTTCIIKKQPEARNYFFAVTNKCWSFFVQYCGTSVTRQRFSFQNNPKNLNRLKENKTDLDLWDCVGKEKLILQQNFTRPIQISGAILQKGKTPYL